MSGKFDLFDDGSGSGRTRAVASKAAVSDPKSKTSSKAPVGGTPGEAGYTASAIEVLEGLEPVRRRPGMYIGGTDEKALHHLFAEVIDNAMDEAVAGHASVITVELEDGGFLSVTDNGRGIPMILIPNSPKNPLWK